jgi:dTDP-4-dehydrorhamnose reductase
MLTAGSRQHLKPELWGGVECTINRIGDAYCDQLRLSGHYDRPDDMALFAGLGIKALRYPILWERHEPTKGQRIDWAWAERQLECARAGGMTVIAGLLHHGSGPQFTDLLDPQFATHFERYARAMAEKFPWITAYTPINEPLTTARFSGLYGLWYPHWQDDRAFVQMLIHQVKGIVLAMKAIRRVNPAARLVQTEDLGKTHSTPHLAYQADFENERRWLTYDLLCGKVTRDHALWEYLRNNGIDETSLHFFIENPCVPDIAGMNYYVTSERFLDERVRRHPSASIGGNRYETYADVEAVRVIPCDGVEALLREAWERYGLPLAVTEVHMGCTREEQMRWLQETWSACCRLRHDTIDVRALTVWSLLGSYNWNSLLTRDDKHYESGVFHVSDGTVRPTALATQATALASVGSYQHPLLNQKGWWSHAGNRENTPVLILRGKTGPVEEVLQQCCIQRNIPYLLVTGSESPIDDRGAWGIMEVIEYPDAGIEGAGEGVLTTSAIRYSLPFLTIVACEVAPDALPELVNTSIDLFIDRIEGLWNISHKGVRPMEQAWEKQHLRENILNSWL